MSPPRAQPVTAELMPSEVGYLLQETPTMGCPDATQGWALLGMWHNKNSAYTIQTLFTKTKQKKQS